MLPTCVRISIAHPVFQQVIFRWWCSECLCCIPDSRVCNGSTQISLEPQFIGNIRKHQETSERTLTAPQKTMGFRDYDPRSAKQGAVP